MIHPSPIVVKLLIKIYTSGITKMKMVHIKGELTLIKYVHCKKEKKKKKKEEDQNQNALYFHQS
jgi:hypothetical protein